MAISDVDGPITKGARWPCHLAPLASCDYFERLLGFFCAFAPACVPALLCDAGRLVFLALTAALFDVARFPLFTAELPRADELRTE
jgi:hypothetical protein